MSTPVYTNSAEVLAAVGPYGQAVDVPLTTVPPPSMDKEGYVIESGEVGMSVLWASEDRTAAAGIWEATPGVVRGVFLFDENDLIVTGRMTVTPKGGEPFEVRAGDLVHFPNGVFVTWEVHETVRKFFTIHNADGLPL